VRAAHPRRTHLCLYATCLEQPRQLMSGCVHMLPVQTNTIIVGTRTVSTRMQYVRVLARPCTSKTALGDSVNRGSSARRQQLHDTDDDDAYSDTSSVIGGRRSPNNTTAGRRLQRMLCARGRHNKRAAQQSQSPLVNIWMQVSGRGACLNEHLL
jgi:hypothetical protein